MSTPYWFAPDGDDEPTMWRPDPAMGTDHPTAVLRRCENPEVFDLLKTSGTTHGDPYLSPWQTNPTATPWDGVEGRDLTFGRGEDDTANTPIQEGKTA